ncbi:uncharacterized protein LOC113514679 [Galleria mellonella]|uniref:Uncharacterized protein LOC113514679 n=1 Tax=Galleria mellonella TaxID=7137 RepID=A0ABM3MAZ8_GALME|nr:uncharacterized protein LOC113514679 [Galleria mellonella]
MKRNQTLHNIQYRKSRPQPVNRNKKKKSANVPTTNKFWADIDIPPDGPFLDPETPAILNLEQPKSVKVGGNVAPHQKPKIKQRKASASGPTINSEQIKPALNRGENSNKTSVASGDNPSSSVAIGGSKMEETQQPNVNVNQSRHIQVKPSIQTHFEPESPSQANKKDAVVLYTINPQKNVTFTVLQPTDDSAAYNTQRQRYSSYGGFTHSRPKGIPKSFLMQQNQDPGRMIQHNIQTIQRIPPTMNWSGQPNTPTAPSYNEEVPEQQAQLYVETSQCSPVIPQPYSPSDIYMNDISDNINNENDASQDSNEDVEFQEAGGSHKRLSAFQRLGPLTQPKKPKLTINLLCNKKESVREVLDLTNENREPEYVPVHLRQDVITSTDETVMKNLINWPWKKTVPVQKSVTARQSKSVMILEQEQMESHYEKDNQFIQVSIKGYPPTWKKEKVLDALLHNLEGKSFIPCFIEFTPQECKFLVIRSREALLTIHKMGFVIHVDGQRLILHIQATTLTLNHLDFIPRIVLKKRLAAEYDGRGGLSLREFTLQHDVSHFIYFPLNRPTNQAELCQLQSGIVWEYLTKLDLSHNRIESLEWLQPARRAPRLRELRLEHNRLARGAALLPARGLPLRALALHGNPLCADYTEPARYRAMLRALFPALREIDDVPIQLKGEMPPFIKNYCPEDAQPLVEKFLEVFFPLLEASRDDRLLLEGLYAPDALLTLTYKYKYIYRYFRKQSHRSRFLDEGEKEVVSGGAAIARAASCRRELRHDPYSFAVDVLHHTDTTTIIKVVGLAKLTSDSLADDEHILSFARTLVLRSDDGHQYTISNELLLWDEPDKEYASSAFQITKIRSRRLSLKLDEEPNEELKRQFIDIFVHLTNLDKKASER